MKMTARLIIGGALGTNPKHMEKIMRELEM